MAEKDDPFDVEMKPFGAVTGGKGMPFEINPMAAAVRSLFTNKSPKMQSKVDAIWREHAAGDITADEARRKITQTAGGFKVPTW